MRRKWTDYIRLNRIDFSWSNAKMRSLLTGELELEKDLLVFHTALMTLIVVVMFGLSYDKLFALNVFYWVLGFCFLVLVKSAAMILTMQEELHSRKHQLHS